MHTLVPHFILENDAQGKRQGSFDAVGLFVDVSGFSAMADVMMQQGQHGAEVMRAIFDPLIASVYGQGGFVATLAGDALTALFPLDQTGSDAYVRALAAAWQIQAQMVEQPHHHTPYGVFAVAAKVGLATGAVHWGIVAAVDDTRASYYFQGAAVDGCAAAEHLAHAGQIIVAANALAQVQTWVTARPVADHCQITAVTGVLPAGRSVTLPTVDAARLSRFYPPALITQRHSGEFREVVNVFVNLPTVRTAAQLAIFMQTIFDNTVLGVMSLLCAESCQQPVVLMIEEAHWLDEDSRLFLARFWHSLAAAVEQPYPIAILATARNEGGALLPEPTSYPKIDLGGLARADLAQISPRPA